MYTQEYVSGPQFCNPFSNSVVIWQLFLFYFTEFDDCFFSPSRKINLSAFCFSQSILKLLTPGRLFKVSSSGTFTLRVFMKSAYSKLVSPTKMDIYFFQTTHRSVCRNTYSLMFIYLQLTADSFERSLCLPSFDFGRFQFERSSAVQTVDSHEMFFFNKIVAYVYICLICT